MIDQMMQSAIRAMGFEPEEFREMVSDALNAMVELRAEQKTVLAKLDRIERMLDSETVPAIPGTNEQEAQHEKGN